MTNNLKNQRRNKLQIMYRNVSRDPGAEIKANHAPGLRDDLLALGFRRVALLEARLSDSINKAKLSQAMHSSDAQVLVDAAENGEGAGDAGVGKLLVKDGAGGLDGVAEGVDLGKHLEPAGGQAEGKEHAGEQQPAREPQSERRGNKRQVL